MSFVELPFTLPAPLMHTLEQAYRTPPRAYHNLEHVREVLAQYASVDGWHDPGSVALAVLFHDAVYRAGRRDNEAESALLARRALREHPPAARLDLARVEALILLTARHGSLQPETLDHDEAHFLDCDMAILGAPRARFRAYELAIAEEYAHLSPAVYRAGRSAFLRKLLQAPSIFLSATFHERLDAAARENLSWAMEALSEAL